MSHISSLSAHLIFQHKYFPDVCFKENVVCLIHVWKICMYYVIDRERNIVLNNFMADMPKAIQDERINNNAGKRNSLLKFC